MGDNSKVEAQEPAIESKHPRIRSIVGTSNANHFSSRHGRSRADEATYIWGTLPDLGLSRLRSQHGKRNCDVTVSGTDPKAGRHRGSYIAVGPCVRQNLGDRRFPYRERLAVLCAACPTPPLHQRETSGCRTSSVGRPGVSACRDGLAYCALCIVKTNGSLCGLC